MTFKHRWLIRICYFIMLDKGYKTVEVEQLQVGGVMPDLTCTHVHADNNCTIEIQTNGDMVPKISKKLMGYVQVLIDGRKYDLNRPLGEIVDLLEEDIYIQLDIGQERKIDEYVENIKRIQKKIQKDKYEACKEYKLREKKRIKESKYNHGFGC